MHDAWDAAKAEAHLAAHGVSFTEAVSVLEDDFALTREDPESEGEQRFVTLGMSSFAHLLVVVYTYRELNRSTEDWHSAVLVMIHRTWPDIRISTMRPRYAHA